MKILVLNAGSSSLKYQLFDMEKETILAKGLCERIGTGGAVTHKPTGKDPVSEEISLPDHGAALERVLALLTDATHGVVASIEEIDAVGHRVAHGGEELKESARITASTIAYLESIIPINPLHGPPAIAGIKACLALMPSVPQVAVFDTSFYSEIEDFRYVYPIPYEFYEQDRVRRYGFHGTSHRFVSAELAKALGKPIEELKIVTCHLGNGSSICAVDGGKSVDTSMGFTPLAGLPMGTRSGDVDPGILQYLMNKHGMNIDEMLNILNKKSGVEGLSHISSDFRDLEAASREGNPVAQLARLTFAYAVKKYIGAYAAAMNGLDAVVFTAGVGENDTLIRNGICQGMEWLGIDFDGEANASLRGVEAFLTKPESKTKVLLIPTNEELMIAMDTAAIVKGL